MSQLSDAELSHTALDWTVSEWLNTPPGFSVHDLRGRVVVAAAFQMLCPGCVDQTIPQLKRVAASFRREEVAVVGLHSVFEHHDAMTPTALRAFLHEYRVSFPVAIDRPDDSGGPIPQTMHRYGMQGTPTLLVYDARGRVRRTTLGHVPDMQLAIEVTHLLHEAGPEAGADVVCDDLTCRLA